MAIPNPLKIIIFFFFGLACGLGLFVYFKQSSPKTISISKAAEFIGQKKTLTGTIESVKNNRKAVFIDFGDPHADGVRLFRIRINKENWPNFPKPPEDMFAKGDQISITGVIQWYQGDPIIDATSPLDFTPSQ